MYCSLLKRAKKSADAESILALLSFYKTTLKSEPADNALPDYGELKSQLADFLASEYKIVLDPPKEASLPMYLLYLKGFEDFSDTDEQGNLKATDRNLNLKAPKEVQIEAFEPAPDGRLTVSWNPCYLTCWILYGDVSFVNNVKKDIDAHLEENSELLDSKEKLGEIKPREANHERFEYASNYIATLVKEFEADGQQYLVASTTESCAAHLADVVARYEELADDADQSELSGGILDGLLIYKLSTKPAANGYYYNKEDIEEFSLQAEPNRATNSLNRFPGTWLNTMFKKPSELICPAGKVPYSILPPLKYAETLKVVVTTYKSRPILEKMSGEVPVVYCPYHEIVGLTDQRGKFRENYAGCLYLGSKTNLVRFVEQVRADWSGQEQWKENVEPAVMLRYSDGHRNLSFHAPTTKGDQLKEIIGTLKTQERVSAEQIVESFKAK